MPKHKRHHIAAHPKEIKLITLTSRARPYKMNCPAETKSQSQRKPSPKGKSRRGILNIIDAGTPIRLHRYGVKTSKNLANRSSTRTQSLEQEQQK